MYLQEGPTRPTIEALDAFFAAAKRARPDAGIGDHYHVRCIGMDAASAQSIIGRVRDRDKTGTFALPWLIEKTGQPAPAAGDDVILIDYDGVPTLLVKITALRPLIFGEMTNADIAIDGEPVRDMAVWRPIHFAHWNRQLAPFGMAVSDDMPVLGEPFDLIYDAAAR